MRPGDLEYANDRTTQLYLILTTPDHFPPYSFPIQVSYPAPTPSLMFLSRPTLVINQGGSRCHHSNISHRTSSPPQDLFAPFTFFPLKSILFTPPLTHLYSCASRPVWGLWQPAVWPGLIGTDTVLKYSGISCPVVAFVFSSSMKTLLQM